MSIRSLPSVWQKQNFADFFQGVSMCGSLRFAPNQFCTLGLVFSSRCLNLCLYFTASCMLLLHRGATSRRKTDDPVSQTLDHHTLKVWLWWKCVKVKESESMEDSDTYCRKTILCYYCADQWSFAACCQAAHIKTTCACCAVSFVPAAKCTFLSFKWNQDETNLSWPPPFAQSPCGCCPHTQSGKNEVSQRGWRHHVLRFIFFIFR